MHKLVLLAIGVCPLASVGLLSLIKGGAMAEKKDATYDRLIKVGLQDPFIRGIAGVVVIATAASIAISTLGSGTKAIITIALSLLFGVVLVVLRALMKYADSTFVRIICFGSSAVIRRYSWSSRYFSCQRLLSVGRSHTRTSLASPTAN